jgi:hypothetical protein
MTVRELRQKLFEVEDQDAEAVIGRTTDGPVEALFAVGSVGRLASGAPVLWTGESINDPAAFCEACGCYFTADGGDSRHPDNPELCRDCHDGEPGLRRAVTAFLGLKPAKTATFRTSDGYTLAFDRDSGMWATAGDGDEFEADAEGWPVDRWGAKLEGEYAPDR